MRPSNYRLASWALERIGERLGVRVAKALNPLDPEDFITISVRLATALRGAAKGAEADALKAAIETLDVDWPTMTDAKRAKVVEAARAEVLRASAAIKPVAEVLDGSAASLVARTRAASIKRFGLEIVKEPTKADANVATLLRRSQMVYIKDEFGRRADAFDSMAKNIVASGLERGLGRTDIAEELGTKLAESQVNRAANYWSLIANDFANKSRTTTQINAFDEADIKVYVFSAVMDSHTTPICQMLDGKQWQVSPVKAQLDSALELEDPEDIRDARPWVRSDKNSMFIEVAGVRSVVAEFSGKSVKQTMSDDDLLAAGVTCPPVHSRCRSTIVAA